MLQLPPPQLPVGRPAATSAPLTPSDRTAFPEPVPGGASPGLSTLDPLRTRNLEASPAQPLSTTFSGVVPFTASIS